MSEDKYSGPFMSRPPTVREIAEREQREAEQKANISRYREVFAKLSAARKVVTNLERELEDLDAELADG